jgi:DNA-binding MarR family transcriptional regulator
MLWRRRIESELAELQLTLAQWLVLDALDVIFRETKDAAAQIQVGRRLGMDKATVSQVMALLERRALVDRAPEYPGNAWRIYVTNRGQLLLAKGRAVVDAVSATMKELPPPAREVLRYYAPRDD